MMNTRRQKIWLVSMLSLMVVLSAYYLFTDDLNKMDDVQLQAQDGSEQDHDLGSTYDSQFAGGDGFAITDEEILAQVESLRASAAVMDQFDALQFNRDQYVKHQFDEINRIITDPSQSTEAMSEAYAELHLLEEQYAIIDSLEERLMQEYGNAIITPEANGDIHVRVLAEHMEKSQALSIIETVAGELGVQNRDVFVTIMN